MRDYSKCKTCEFSEVCDPDIKRECDSDEDTCNAMPEEEIDFGFYEAIY